MGPTAFMLQPTTASGRRYAAYRSSVRAKQCCTNVKACRFPLDACGRATPACGVVSSTERSKCVSCTGYCIFNWLNQGTQLVESGRDSIMPSASGAARRLNQRKKLQPFESRRVQATCMSCASIDGSFQMATLLICTGLKVLSCSYLFSTCLVQQCWQPGNSHHGSIMAR